MSNRLPNNIWRYRKRHGLSQNDVACFLASHDGSSVSRFEQGTREPSLRAALAYHAIFSVPVHELFPGIYEEVEKEVQQRARDLSQRPKMSKGSRELYRQTLLNSLVSGKDHELAQQT